MSDPQAPTGLEQSRPSTGAGAFTKGPWECRRALHPDNTGGFDYAIAADGKIIAEAFEHVDYADGRDGYDCRPVAANARLIAAAPDLYEALEKIVDCYGVGSTSEQFARNVRDFMEEGRKAIRLALGDPR